MPTLATPHQLAQTFSTDGDISAWERAQQYQRVADYTDRHPDEGSNAVASALDLPVGRVASWVDQGSKPQAIHAIDTARAHGWLDLDADSSEGRPWVRLVAWIYSAGSLRTSAQHPTFYVDNTIHILPREPLAVLEKALDDIGVGMTVSTRDDGKPREIRPASQPVLVGRMLQAMGAPVGRKRDNDRLRLPDWLFESSQDTQRVFARIYIQNRGSTQDRDRSPVRFRVEWAEQYHEDVARLFRQASGFEDGVTLASHMLKISPDVVDAILD